MLVELLDNSNYVSFNSSVARLTDLQTAIYLSELIQMSQTNKTEKGFFTVDRKLITYRTTLSVSEQRERDGVLKGLQIIVLSQSDKDRVSLDIPRLLSWIGGDESKKINPEEIIVKKKRSKSEVIADKLKACVDWNDTDLNNATHNWIDAVMSKDGWMSKEAVTSAKCVVINFASDYRGMVDKAKALALLNEASINGYRDMQWAVNSYIRKNGSNSAVVMSHQTPEQEEISRIGF